MFRVIDIFRQYGGNVSFHILALIALVGIYLRQNDRYRKRLKWFIVTITILVFNDLAYWLIAKFNGEYVYYRFFWMFPVTIIIAIFISSILNEQWANKKLCIIVISMAVGIAFIGGQSSIGLDGMVVAENIYKIPDEVIQISEILHEDAGDDNIVIATDYEMLVYYRQYDASVRLTYGLQAYNGQKKMTEEQVVIYEVLQNRNWQEVQTNDFLDSLKMRKVNYVVVAKNEELNEYLLQAGLICLNKDSEYLVYRVEND